MRALLAPCLLALAAGCQSTLATEELFRFPAPVDAVHLSQVDGDVRVSMTPRGDVRVVATSHHWGSGKPTTLLSMNDGTLEAGYTREPGVGGSSVDFAIELPSGVTEVVARSERGDLELVDLFGDLDVRTKSGDVAGVSLFTSSARVATASGDVSLSFSSPPEWVSIETDTGDVELELPGSGWQVRVTTSTGDVDIAPGMVGDSGDRRIEVTTRAGDVRVTRR